MTLSVLMTASRFGGRLFYSSLQQVAPSILQLEEVMRPGSNSLRKVTTLTGLQADEIKSLSRQTPETLCKHIYEAASAQNLSVIIRVLYYNQSRDSALWEYIHNNARVVNLVRRNLFEAFLSREEAHLNKAWTFEAALAINPNERKVPTDVNVKKLRDYIQERREEVSWCRETFGAIDFHEFFFEDLIRSPGAMRSALLQAFPGIDAGAQIELQNAAQAHRCNVDRLMNYSEFAHFDRYYF